MAAPNPVQGQPEPARGTMFFQRFKGVGRACGLETTAMSNPRRSDQSIRANWERNDPREEGHAADPCSLCNARRKSSQRRENLRSCVTPGRPIKT